MKKTVFNKQWNSQNGGIKFRVIIAFITLFIIGAIIYTIIQNFQQNGQENHRKAIEIAEYGMLLTLQKINEEPNWRDGFKKSSYDNGFFSVELHPFLQEQALYMTIVSQGQISSVTEERQIVLKLQINGSDSTWIPAEIH